VTGINTVASVYRSTDLTANTNQVVSTTSSVYALRPNLAAPKAVYGSTLTSPRVLSAVLRSRLSQAAGTHSSAMQAATICAASSAVRPAAHKSHVALDRQTLDFRIELSMS